MKAHISELIKIAYEHDELRSDLVPLIHSELKVARRGRGRARRRFKDMESNRGRQRAEEGARRRQQEAEEEVRRLQQQEDESQRQDTHELTVEQGAYSEEEVKEILSNFAFIGHIKREYYGKKWVHPKTELQNTINTIVEKARDGDEFAIDLILIMWADYDDSNEETSEQYEEIKEAFDDLDLTDFRQGKAVEGFCSLVGKSMTMGSWTGRNTYIGELVDDTLWSIDASYGPLIRALKEVRDALDKNKDGKLQREEIIDYVKLAASSGLELDLGDAAASGVTAALLKNALEEVLISALMAKMTFSKTLGGKIGKRVVAKVVTHLLGAILDDTGINGMVEKATDSAINYVAEKVDTGAGKVGVGRVGTAMKRRAEAAALVPSKINEKYQDKVTALADSVGNTPSARDLERIATETLTLAEQYFTEGAAEIDNAISDSIVYRSGQALTPKFMQDMLMKLSNEESNEESKLDKYILEKLENKTNHTGIVLSYLQQQVNTMRAELHMADNVGPIAQEIYDKFLSKLENKEERDSIIDMIENGEL